MSSRLAQKRRKRVYIFIGIVVACLLVLFAALVLLSNASFLKITSVDVSGQNVIPASSLQDAVQHSISGRYVGLFSKSNIFLYSKKQITHDLLVLYPTLTSVSVNAKNFYTIAVVVAERTPSALWCGADATAPNSTCVLLDANGLAYANAPEYSGHVYQTYFGPLAGGPLPKQFLTPDTFHSLSALSNAFAKKLSPDTLESVDVDANNDVHLLFSGSYKIVFGLHDDSGQIFQRFSLTLGAAPFTSNALSNFEYIDLRFGDKVYYKLKNQ